MNNKKRSCWNCKYQDLKNDTFLGKCTWFPKHNKGKEKKFLLILFIKDVVILNQNNYTINLQFNIVFPFS